jgi:hypothetical protein
VTLAAPRSAAPHPGDCDFNERGVLPNRFGRTPQP